MPREVRYEGVLIDKNRVLMLLTEFAGGSFWLLPGGGREDGEGEEECVARELREETCLEVDVQRLLYDLDWPFDHLYRRKRAYLCHVIGGVLGLGIEPEEELNASIVDLAWVDLTDERTWPDGVLADERSLLTLRTLRQALALP